MCDAFTEAENEAYLERTRFSRREANIGASAALAALLTGCDTTPTPKAPHESKPEPASDSSSDEAPTPATTSRMVTIGTPDGNAEAFFVTPRDGRHPGVLLWPDVAGLREAFETMATRLANEGYAVLVMNPYYRSAKLPILTTFSEWRSEEGKAKITPMREMLTPDAVERDAAAFTAWLDQQPEVDENKKLATTGYCMGGPFTFRTAAMVPDRVGVIASFHGGGLVTDDPKSPHTLFAKMKAAALICIAQNDDARQPEAKTTLREAAAQANTPAEIEVYPAQHGWCAIDSPVYDQEQAERAWRRLLVTLEQHL
jgi:carboxymethylenebutenolidase